MDSARIQAALQGAGDTREVLIGDGALAQVADVFKRSFPGQPAVVIADENTFAVAGREVYLLLSDAGVPIVPPVLFPSDPPLYAEFSHVLALEELLRSLGAVAVAVGSGTLNDLCKLASHRVGQQYMCVGTAASMDGYTAFGAAITKDGFKQTMECAAPRAVLADLRVLAQAPAQMNATGYGDLLGKVTAGADWILADALGIEPIDERAWPLVQDSLREWTGRPDLVRAGDPGALSSLFEGLIMAGVAMQISASSRPASGCEHRFSHLWEMEALAHGHPAIPHGFKVGIGTIAGAALYERVLAADMDAIDIDARCRAWPTREQVERSVRQGHDSPQIAENAVAESLAKYITPEQLRERLLLIRQLWPQIRPRLEAQLLPAATIRDMLAAVGCPTTPAEIGLSLDHVRESYWLARTIRSRYTVLDLVNETGLLEPCVAQLFAPGGYWV
ncbi:sn-glycerol-1-phosphate dehydrogenase [Chloroflexia bacterium SDU3-3]|nr:sn-glycerol-1-phosphate dehydrogenase [Chloroflexia bacterium SDU3-3]